MANLFDKAKKTSAAKAPKKDDKVVVNVKGTGFAENLEKMAELDTQIKDLTAELAMAKEYVKGVAIDEFANLIDSKKSNPGSFVLASEKGGTVMVVPTKKYITIDETAASTLKETYGEDIVTEETTFGFNTEILMKHMDLIGKLIEDCAEISDEDKANLINATTKFSVEKDALDKVYSIAKEKEVSVKEVIEDIQPVVMMKNPKAN